MTQNNKNTFISAVIFDLGGVLIDWNPRHLYQKVFRTDEAIEYFLRNICTMEWNEEQDAGRKWADGIQSLSVRYPEYRSEIAAYFDRWEEMLKGQIDASVLLFERLLKNDVPVYALTNWSSETFPMALERYPFLSAFKGIVVSGHEGVRKPNPSIFQICTNRYNLVPAQTLFIDDNLRNVQAARDFGFQACHYLNPAQLNDVLSPLFDN
jgi:2-haloacid dehalogenase